MDMGMENLDLRFVMGLRHPPRLVTRAFVAGLALTGLIKDAEIQRLLRLKLKDMDEAAQLEWQSVRKVLVPKKQVLGPMLLEKLQAVDCVSLVYPAPDKGDEDGCTCSAALNAVRSLRDRDEIEMTHSFSVEHVFYASRFAGNLVRWTQAVLEEADHYETGLETRRRVRRVQRLRSLLADVERRQGQWEEREKALSIRTPTSSQRKAMPAARAAAVSQGAAGRSSREAARRRSVATSRRGMTRTATGLSAWR
jgi:hypothetical protein